MARAVVGFFEKWAVSNTTACEILGGLPKRTYERWKAGDIGRIDRDLATRLSLLMGIHTGLRYLFTDPGRGYAWVRKPNHIFGGCTPVEVMAEGSMLSLRRVYDYLWSAQSDP